MQAFIKNYLKFVKLTSGENPTDTQLKQSLLPYEYYDKLTGLFNMAKLQDLPAFFNDKDLSVADAKIMLRLMRNHFPAALDTPTKLNELFERIQSQDKAQLILDVFPDVLNKPLKDINTAQDLIDLLDKTPLVSHRFDIFKHFESNSFILANFYDRQDFASNVQKFLSQEIKERIAAVVFERWYIIYDALRDGQRNMFATNWVKHEGNYNIKWGVKTYSARLQQVVAKAGENRASRSQRAWHLITTPDANLPGMCTQQAVGRSSRFVRHKDAKAEARIQPVLERLQKIDVEALLAEEAAIKADIERRALAARMENGAAFNVGLY